MNNDLIEKLLLKHKALLDDGTMNEYHFKDALTAIRDATLEAAVGCVPPEQETNIFAHLLGGDAETQMDRGFQACRTATLKAIEALREPLN